MLEVEQVSNRARQGSTVFCLYTISIFHFPFLCSTYIYKISYHMYFPYTFFLCPTRIYFHSPYFFMSNMHLQNLIANELFDYFCFVKHFYTNPNKHISHAFLCPTCIYVISSHFIFIYVFYVQNVSTKSCIISVFMSNKSLSHTVFCPTSFL